MIPLLLNQLQVVSAQIHIPAIGVWVADLDVDLDPTGIVPSGPAIFTVGTSLLSGTIDDRRSGKFGAKAHVRLVGGAGGWDKPVSALHLQNDFGVITTAVYSATAAEVLERVVDVVPGTLGTDFVRCAGQASRVFAGVEWWVDFTGVTFVGPRPVIPPSPDIDILSWDPATRCAQLASDGLVVPGTTLVDLRFGTATVRDVCQTFNESGARVVAWCAPSSTPGLSTLAAPETPEPGSRLGRALAALAKESAGVAYLKRYRYRVVLQGADKRLTLQLVRRKSGAPDFLRSVEIAMGIPGASALVTPASQVFVVFIEGDPSQPIVTGFVKTTPIELTLDAARVAVGLGLHPVARADVLLECLAAICAAGGLTAPAMEAALASFTATIPSTKLFTE